MKKVKRIWQVLLGEVDTTFCDEEALRYFQFKWWLLGSNSQLRAFSEAAMIFGALRFRAFATSSPDRQNRRRRIVKFFSNKSRSRLFETCFPNADLLAVLSREQCMQAFNVRLILQKDVQHYVVFGKLRLELSELAGRRVSKEFVFSHLTLNDYDNIYRTTEEKKFLIRSKRTAYLMAASELMKDLLQIGDSYEEFIDNFDQGVPLPHEFRNYLEAVWAIDAKLRTGGKNEVETLAGITKGEMPVFAKLKAKRRSKPIRRRPKKIAYAGG